MVGEGLDWVEGDELFFAATNHQWTHGEYRKIQSYDSVSGLLVVDKPFTNYHFGQD